MSDTIYKLADDHYVVWSSSVDAPLIWGARAEIETFLRRHAHCQRCIADEIVGRFERVDRNGTSSLVYPMPTSLIYLQVGTIRMDRLRAFLASGVSTFFDLSLLDPFEDDEVEDFGDVA